MDSRLLHPAVRVHREEDDVIRTHIPIPRSTPIVKKRQRLNPMSDRRRAEGALYRQKREAFLKAHPVCQVARYIPGLNPRAKSKDIHHTAGRYGGAYLDESTWLAVCREAHDWIHAHPREARARGWLV
jgi:hypothetical protein